MTAVRQKRRLIAIVGPTACGKSALAVQAAERLGGEIVNCDALQLHRFLDIGTAKPTPTLRARVPHHLYDLIDPDQYFSAGAYMEQARQVCRDIAQRGRLPLVVGGTGLYLRALLEGIFDGPGRSEILRERLSRIAAARGTACLHRLLARRDPESAGRIRPADRMRIIRALEVYLTTGRSISHLQLRKTPLRGFQILKVGLNLPRSILYDRIGCRVVEMFRSGLLEEVKGLLDRGYRPDCKGFEALGYRHAVAVVRGEISVRKAIEWTRRDTRRYAKRQMTWFRKESGLNWISGPGEDPSSLNSLLDLLSGGAVKERQTEGSV